MEESSEENIKRSEVHRLETLIAINRIIHLLEIDDMFDRKDEMELMMYQWIMRKLKKKRDIYLQNSKYKLDLLFKDAKAD